RSRPLPAWSRRARPRFNWLNLQAVGRFFRRFFRVSSFARSTASTASARAPGADWAQQFRQWRAQQPWPTWQLRQPRRLHRAFKLAGVFLATAALAAIATWPADISAVSTERGVSWGIDRRELAAAITPAIESNVYPPRVALPSVALSDVGAGAGAGELKLRVRYTIDPALQREAQKLLSKYQPDYGVFVALDPDSGRVLAMASNSRAGNAIDGPRNMTMVNSYPAASISKIITAVAAIDAHKTTPASIIPFNGKTTSLYKNHVFKHRDNRWTRKFSFEESFAKSVNSVFGRVGAALVGGDAMLDAAERLGFNGRFASDFAFANGAVELDPADEWQVAEMASGYTRRNTLSPLHGAALAATALNGGHLVAPAVVQSVLGPHGVPLYWHETPLRSKVMRADTALELKRLMRATVIRGSARKSFKGFHRGAFRDALVGGKTGSLRGLQPKGEYDWFVGFGELGAHKIAFAALCINKKRWYVKSTRLARELLEFYFREQLAHGDGDANGDGDASAS
ncbi:MAG: penicillin-binding transpeptidase domain-containing protein, partial [Gammaproteobacteria bacterium]|nr:penicillin-binding transpeptidase domain-containing protein [Gammaproteobacteria bacterium]